MVKKIDHIAIMVEDMEVAKTMFGEGMGLQFEHEESSAEWNSKYAFFHCGDMMIELIQPLGPCSNLDYLNEYGSGIHHICYEVDDITEAMRQADKHFVLRDKQPRAGAFGSQIFFLEPSSMLGIETEFVQKANT